MGQRFIWKALGVHTSAKDRDAGKGEGEVES